MLLLAARYTFYFWLLIGSNNADLLRMQQMEGVDASIYRMSACTARCMQQKQVKQQTLLQSCYNDCSNDTNRASLENLKQIYENFRLKLICRDDRSLTFRIDLERLSNFDMAQNKDNKTFNKTANGTMEIKPQSTRTTKRATIKEHTTLYVIKVHIAHGAEEYLVYLSDDNFFTIDDLKYNTTHSITAVAVHAGNEFSVIAKEQQYTTLQRGYTPGMVTDIQVKDFSADEANDMRLMAHITWKPSADMTCHYNIICFSPESEEYDLTPLEIRNPRQLYTYTLENLTFSSVYKVGIRAKNPNNTLKESELFWKTFRAPSCVNWHNYNFSICAPLEPEGLKVDQNFLSQNEYSLNISWEQPQHFPDYYTVRILDMAENGNSYTLNVSRQLNSLFIPTLIIRGYMYEVHLTAYTPGGHSTAVVTDLPKMLVLMPEKNHVVKVFIVLLAPIFCLLVLSFTTFMICHRRAKLKRYQERCKYFEELEKKAPIDPKAAFDFPNKTLSLLTTTPEDLAQFQLEFDDKILLNDAMEIDRNNVTLYEVLGEGAFGLVRRGIYSDERLGPREVAVKMLKDQPTTDDVRAFRREIEVMKSVEKHPNIVGIIGHCTKRYNEMMLLTEYCSFGNLLDFLRDEWKYLQELNVETKPIGMAPAPNYLAKPSSKRHVGRSLNRQYAEQPLHHNNHTNIDNKTNNIQISVEPTIIGKLKLKYKHLNMSPQRGKKKDTQQQQQEKHSATNQVEEIIATTTSTSLATPTKTTAADNKSYFYDEICTNACKCHVDVIFKDIGTKTANADADAAQLQQMQKQNTNTTTTSVAAAAKAEVHVKNCECQQLLRSAKNNKRNANDATAAVTAPLPLSVENRSYFKCLPDSSSRRLRKRHRKPKQQQQQKSRRQSNDLPNGSAMRQSLTAADLLDIARQVAVGMEFLAKNKVVHRDLAARNVLVAPDRTIKIADFGLSRDVYQENIYKKTGSGKLPIKWLALESMTHQVYTTQSDVWSYGILLYEIVTLGGTPYPSFPTNRLLHMLKTGYRMGRPSHCGQEFYELMHSCWNTSPAERPNFTQIIKKLDTMLNEAPQQQIDNLHLCTLPRVVVKSVTTEEMDGDAYLKPL